MIFTCWQLREKEADLETSRERQQRLEKYISHQDDASGRQIIEKLTCSLKLSLGTAELDVVNELSADLARKNRENDILENCLKVNLDQWRHSLLIRLILRHGPELLGITTVTNFFSTVVTSLGCRSLWAVSYMLVCMLL